MVLHVIIGMTQVPGNFPSAVHDLLQHLLRLFMGAADAYAPGHIVELANEQLPPQLP